MDSFDDIWKNRFSEGELPANDWNTPDKSVWEGVSAHIEQEKSKRRMLLFWLISSLLSLLLLVGVLGYFSIGLSSNTSGTTADEPSSTTTVVPIEKELTKGTENTNSLNGSLTDGEESSSALPENTLSNTPTTGTDKKETLSTDKQKSSLPVVTGKSDELKRSSYLEENNNVKQEILIPAADKTLPEKKKAKELKILPSIPSLASSLSKQVHEIDVNTPYVDLQLPERSGGNKNFTVALLAGGAYLSHRISDKYEDDLSPFDFQYSNDFGWQAGLQLAVPVIEWMDAWMGIQYEQVNSTSGHNSDLAYDPAAEEDGPNNEYALSLATPYGLSDASFILTRGNDDVGTDEVNMQVDFESSHQLQNLSVPLGVSLYPLKREKRLTPSIQLGFGINYLNKISNRIEAIDTHNTDIQYNTTDNSTTYGQPEFNNWHFDARLGAGMQYRLTNTLQIQLNYNWSRGLSPVFEDNANKYRTSIDRHALLIGITSKL